MRGHGEHAACVVGLLRSHGLRALVCLGLGWHPVRWVAYVLEWTGFRSLKLRWLESTGWTAACAARGHGPESLL